MAKVYQEFLMLSFKKVCEIDFLMENHYNVYG